MFIRVFTIFRAVSFPGLAHRWWLSSCRGLCGSRSGRSLQLSPSRCPALHVVAVSFPDSKLSVLNLRRPLGSSCPPPPTMLWPGNSPESKSWVGHGARQPTPLRGPRPARTARQCLKTLISWAFLWFLFVSAGRTNLVPVTSSEMEAKVQSIYF